MNSKAKETRSCGCRHCRLGAGSAYGQAVHRQTNRAIRRETKRQLRTGDIAEFVPIRGATPYTD